MFIEKMVLNLQVRMLMYGVKLASLAAKFQQASNLKVTRTKCVLMRAFLGSCLQVKLRAFLKCTVHS